MQEIWKDVVGYEGYYKVSNLGRVKSLDRINNKGVTQIGRVLKCGYRSGYKSVALSKNGKSVSCVIHRLVAIAFVPNKNNKPQVNHIDEDKNNNNVNNLEWVTAKENNNYGTHNARQAKTRSKPIKVIYQDDTYEIWESATIFAKEYSNGVSQQNIVKVLKGKRASTVGLRFEYASSEEK